MCKSVLLKFCDIDQFGFFFTRIYFVVVPELNELCSGTDVTELDKH